MTWRRVAVALGLMIACVFSASAPSYAATSAPTPAPYPSSGGAASSWSCSNVTVTPTADPTADPTATAPPPYVDGQDCTVTAWGTNPPYPTPPAAATGPSEVSGTVHVDDAQAVPLVFGLGVLVMVGLAGAVIRWSRPPAMRGSV